MMRVRILSAVRLLRVGLHLAYGAAIVACVYPWVPERMRERIRRAWTAGLLAMLKVRLRTDGGPAPRRGLLVANHVSWLDVLAINSICDPEFVCKDDVRRWPLVGWLCGRNGVIFIDRRRPRDAQRVRLEIGARLRTGKLVAVFPEGTTSEGASLLPFRGALLQPAVDVGTDVFPVAMRYLDTQGNRTAAASYYGTETLWGSLYAIASQPGLTAEVRVLQPIAGADRTRRALAAQAHARISACLDSRSLRPRRESGAHNAHPPGTWAAAPADPRY